MKIHYYTTPLAFVGFNTEDRTAFTMALTDQAVEFIRLNFPVKQITTNYSMASLADFVDSDIELIYGFTYPTTYIVGNRPSKLYGHKKEPIKLNIKSFTLHIQSQAIQVNNFRSIEENKYIGQCHIVIN